MSDTRHSSIREAVSSLVKHYPEDELDSAPVRLFYQLDKLAFSAPGDSEEALYEKCDWLLSRYIRQKQIALPTQGPSKTTKARFTKARDCSKQLLETLRSLREQEYRVLFGILRGEADEKREVLEGIFNDFADEHLIPYSWGHSDPSSLVKNRFIEDLRHLYLVCDAAIESLEPLLKDKTRNIQSDISLTPDKLLIALSAQLFAHLNLKVVSTKYQLFDSFVLLIKQAAGENLREAESLNNSILEYLSGRELCVKLMLSLKEEIIIRKHLVSNREAQEEIERVNALKHVLDLARSEQFDLLVKRFNQQISKKARELESATSAISGLT